MRTGAVALALISSGACSRIKHRGTEKFIAGVPVTNYHLANGGQAASLAEADAATSYKEDWLVTVSKKTTNDDLNNMCAHANGDCKMVGHPQGGAPVFELSGTEADLAEVLTEAPGMALTIEPNVEVQIIDPAEFQSDAASTRRGPFDGAAGWNLNAVGKDTAATTGKGVHVHIVDSGMRTTHTDFGGRGIPAVDMTTGAREGKVITKECKGDPTCGMDDIGHGTHCAGTAGGDTYGLATDSLLYNLKITFGTGSTHFVYAIGALDWIMVKGKRPAVVSASWGFKITSPAVISAVESLVEEGIIFINAAGNSRQDACLLTPGVSPASFTIGATNMYNMKWRNSCHGKCVNLWAPGRDILSAYASSSSASVYMSGTSMATPLVSGAAALLLEAKPDMSPAEVRAKILSNALVGHVSHLGTDDTNLMLWVGSAQSKPEKPTGPPPDWR